MSSCLELEASYCELIELCRAALSLKRAIASSLSYVELIEVCFDGGSIALDAGRLWNSNN